MQIDRKTKMLMCLLGMIACSGCKFECEYSLEHKTENSIFVADDGYTRHLEKNKIIQLTNTDSIKVHDWMKTVSINEYKPIASWRSWMTGKDRKAPIEEDITKISPEEMTEQYRYVQSDKKWLLLKQNSENENSDKYKAIYLNSDSIQQTTMMKQCTPETIMSLAEWRCGLGIETPLVKKAEHHVEIPQTEKQLVH